MDQRARATSMEEEKEHSPRLALEVGDIGDLDSVLRDYYLSQIKKLEGRKDRKLARKLLENHLVLPKSRRRTSKDAAYIKEVVGMEPLLLSKLEESRLIRRINKRGNNPIYEISHDTLVEPILAGRRDREAIALFLRKSWRYAAFLLLLWFLLGMLFQSAVEVLPKPFRKTKNVALSLNKQLISLQPEQSSLMLKLPPTSVNQTIHPSDSIQISLPLGFLNFSLAELDSMGKGQDTISIRLSQPIDIPIHSKGRQETFQAFSNVVVPLAIQGTETSSKPLYGNVSGNLKVQLVDPNLGQSRGENLRKASKAISLNLGDTTLRATATPQAVPISRSMRLTDLFEDENEKNQIRNSLGDRPLKLRYMVQVQAANIPASPPRTEYISVQGIEVQYSDGTKRVITGNPDGQRPPGNRNYEITHRVEAGETLFSIARKYGLLDAKGNTSTAALKQLNGLRGNTISIGQVLRIPPN